MPRKLFLVRRMKRNGTTDLSTFCRAASRPQWPRKSRQNAPPLRSLFGIKLSRHLLLNVWNSSKMPPLLLKRYLKIELEYTKASVLTLRCLKAILSHKRDGKEGKAPGKIMGFSDASRLSLSHEYMKEKRGLLEIPS